MIPVLLFTLFPTALIEMLLVVWLDRQSDQSNTSYFKMSVVFKRRFLKLITNKCVSWYLLVVSKDLLAEVVDKLVETQIHFGLHLVVQELLAEDGQRVHGTVVVQIQRVQHVSATRGVMLVVQGMVSAARG